MKVLGLDIGTSTISAVVYHVNQGVLTAKTVKNDSFMPGESWEKIQDPTIIYEIAMASVHEMLTLHPDIQTIGVTGQMHGIVYLDAAGDPVSPLYIWQDDRGDLPCDETRTWASHLSRITGYEVATGYGMVTHYYNINHGLVPENAAVFCTIHDFLAMKLAGLSRPLTEPTNASSFGLFDGPNGCFDKAAMKASGIDDTLVPGLIENPCLGIGPLGLPVYAAIGDNQVSFLGATRGRTDVLLVNIGAGSQISVYSPAHIHTQTMETRPFPDGGWLLTGASLCGGRAYALLESFETVELFGGTARHIEGNLYCLMSGQVYDIDGKKVLCFAGGEDVDAEIAGKTLQKGQLPDPELLKESLDRVLENGGAVDCIVSYEPPFKMAQFINLDRHLDDSFYPCFLDEVSKKVTFNCWYFGKYHRDKTIPPRYQAVFTKYYNL